MAEINFVHIPVLFEETIESLAIEPDGLYIDTTAGAGGHSAGILQRLGPKGRLICIDQDPDAITVLTERFGQDKRVTVCKTNFSQMEQAVDASLHRKVSGILMDIGISSFQVDEKSRGFSFHEDAPLRMDMSQEGVTAAELVNTLSWQELAEIFSRYGEEKYAKSIAQNIVKARQTAPVERTLQLAEIIKESVPFSYRREGHPARKSFQALRIAVNRELEVLEEGMESAFKMLKPGGRLSVITFHSLEDRMAKRQMAAWCVCCVCPSDFPVCCCGGKAKGQLAFKKPVSASERELAENPRSRSAKLRTIIKATDDEEPLPAKKKGC